MKNKKIEIAVVIYGLSMLLALSTTVIITFIKAYLNNKQTIISINCFGEADLELFLILVAIPCMIYAVYYLITEEETQKEKDL